MASSASQSSSGIKVVHLIFASFVLILFALLCLGFIITSNVSYALAGIALVAFGLTLLPSIFNHAKAYDTFQPANFLALTTLFGVTLHTLYILTVDNFTTRNFLMLGRDPVFLNRALIVICLALVCWLIGYNLRTAQLPLQRWSITRATLWNKRRFIWAVWILILVSLVCTFLYMRELGLTPDSLATKLSGKRRLVVEDADYAFAALGYYLWGASLISYAFYLLVAYVAYERLSLRSPMGLAMIVCGLLACVLPFITSSRAEIIYNLLLAIMIWHYARRRISLQTILIVGVIAVTIFAFVGSLRFTGGQVTEDSLQLGSEAFVKSLVGTRNWLGVSKTAHIMAAVPEKISYKLGSTMVGWLVAPVPRTLWKDKPIIRTGQLLGPLVFDATKNLTGSPPGLIAELYLNFSLPAVFIGLLFLGLFIKTLYQSALPLVATHRNVLLLYLMLVLRFSLDIFAGDFNGVMINALRAFVTMLLLLAFISRPWSAAAGAQRDFRTRAA
jgi:oligosaccharide repeat unit polymerase